MCSTQADNSEPMTMAMREPVIFDYLDYRPYLRDLFAFKKETRGLSYRGLAQKAGFTSSNYCLLVIQGKRNLSVEGVHRLAKAFPIPPAQRDYFERLVAFNQARNHEEKEAHFSKLAKLGIQKGYQSLDRDQYLFFSKWYHVALRELIARADFRESVNWVNDKLGLQLSLKEFKQAIDILLNLKLVERQRGRLRVTSEKLSIRPEIFDLNITNFHKSMLVKAAESLDQIPTDEREYGSLTVNLSAAEITEVRKRLIDLRREIHQLASEQTTRDSEIYQLNFQLFRLSRKEG
jgi:uncharacterized protein (TIGR02147 family)